MPHLFRPATVHYFYTKTTVYILKKTFCIVPHARRQDCNFHECAKLDEFESMRQLSFTPPDGEFVLLNYRINAEFRCPFRLFPSIGDIDPYRCRQ